MNGRGLGSGRSDESAMSGLATNAARLSSDSPLSGFRQPLAKRAMMAYETAALERRAGVAERKAGRDVVRWFADGGAVE